VAYWRLYHAVCGLLAPPPEVVCGMFDHTAEVELVECNNRPSPVALGAPGGRSKRRAASGDAGGESSSAEYQQSDTSARARTQSISAWSDAGYPIRQ
jgi:hypothetical protein